MRSLRTPLLLTFLALLGSPSCDPGSSQRVDSTANQGGTNSGTSPKKDPNELFLLPTEPPGEVIMTPPAAGELDVFEQNRALGRGINIGNCLDAPSEGAWGVNLHQYMFEIIKDAGFDSIRLPIKWSNHSTTEAPYTITPSFFDRVDWAIAHALGRGLKIMIDIHHFGNTNEEGIYDEPEKYHDKFLSLWQQIAEHYRDYPKELYFEVLNEPRQSLEPLWNQYLAEAVAVIRESNPGRTLVVGGIWWNKWETLSRVTFPDDNIIATFHYYNPYCFTLQDGQNWEAPCKKPDGTKPASGEAEWPVIYPDTDADAAATEAQQRAKIEQDIAAAAAWGASANRPLYMGEFGVAQSAKATARTDYTATLVRAANQHGITWAYWELAANMGIWNGGKMEWDAAMLEALLPADGGGLMGAAGSSGMAGSAGSAGASTTSAGASGIANGEAGTAGVSGSVSLGGGGAAGTAATADGGSTASAGAGSI